MRWIDFGLGVLLAVGLLYVFYLVDRTFVYRKQKLGFWPHLTTTAFFPRRMVAYLLVWLVALIGIHMLRESMAMPDSLSYNVANSIIQLSLYPFLGLCVIVIIVLLKKAIFPSEDDPDSKIF